MSAYPEEPELDAAEEAPEPEPATEEAASEPAPTVSGPRLVLKRANQETDVVFEIRPPVIVGRFDPEVGPIDVDLGPLPEGAYVSRKHARIDFEDDVYTVTDLGSSNGTFVLRGDFTKVESAPIADGDEIAFGNARFVFRTN